MLCIRRPPVRSSSGLLSDSNHDGFELFELLSLLSPFDAPIVASVTLRRNRGWFGLRIGSPTAVAGASVLLRRRAAQNASHLA